MSLRFKAARSLRHIFKNSCFLAICWSALATLPIHADETFKHGAVMARSLALDDAGQPILVEYNEDGSEGSVIGIPSEYKTRVSELIIIDTAEYRQQKDLLKEYKEHYKETLAKDAELLSREQYLGRTYTTANGKDTITPKEPPKYIKSMLVRGRSNTITKDPDQLILRGFTVDLSQDYQPPEKGTLVLTPKGQVITSSSLNIGPRVGFFGDPNKKQEFYSASRKFDDKIFGPVPYAKVYVAPEIFPGSLAVTDEKGKYSMRYYLGFCPMFMDMETDIWTELHYANFSPNGMPVLPFYLRRQDWSSCWDPVFMGASNLMAAMAYVEVLAIKASAATPIYNIDFKVDVMFLSGKVLLKNPDNSPVDIGDITEYKADPADKNPIAQQFYDFDGDGKPDRSLVGKMVTKTLADGTTEKSFEEDTQKGDIQAIFFSSASDTTQTKTPDVTRQVDTKKLLGNNGLLKSISKDDLKKTDILVFRESTGDLILERKGLKDEEINGRVESGLGKDDKYFFYRLMLRGPMDNALNIGGTVRTGTWEEWSTKNKLAEPFRKRESDLLKPGEWIRLVIINRVTGYMSSKRIQLSDASKNARNTLSIPLDDINLMPPNLKIWAERSYKVENGLTKDEDRNYLIGTEGAALASDAKIEVYSEWFDEEGRPLPEGLGADNGEQYGLTGRLAKVVSKNNLAGVAQGQLASFPIAPGRHTQVLRVKDNLQSPEHFYIHVSGTQKDEKPEFDAAGNHAAAPFDSRPKGLTPFLTPLYDEDKDWQVYNAYRDIKREQLKNEKDTNTPTPEKDKPLKPLPSYAWGYRPEYQFSQYSLEVKEINRVNTDANGVEQKQNILDNKPPVITSSDQLIEILYSLVGSKVDRLDSFDGPQDLVLALGEQELKLTVDKSQKVRFDDLKQLASLSPEDFLTIRLYTNQDAGNILWEYAFETLVISSRLLGYTYETDNTWYVTTDEPTVDLKTTILGYAERDPKKKKPARISWTTSNGGNFSPSTQTDSDTGVFDNTLTMPKVKGLTTKVAVSLEYEGGVHSETSWKDVKVLAGKPDRISLSVTGDAVIFDQGEARIEATVYDKSGNTVEDGTSVDFNFDKSLRVKSQQLSTLSGRAYIVLSGGEFKEAAATVTIKSDQIETTKDIEIKPLKIEITAGKTALKPGETIPLTATVTRPDGSPASGVDVSFMASKGIMQQQDVLTNAAGVAQVNFTAGANKVDDQWVATLGYTTGTRVNYSVNNPNKNISTANSLIVGNTVAPGQISYSQNGAIISADYDTKGTVSIETANNATRVTLGDLSDPNLEPVLALSMNFVDEDNNGKLIIPDEHAIHNGKIVIQNNPVPGLGLNGGISLVHDHPLGGGTSLHFEADSLVKIDSDSVFNRQDNIGFRLDFKPTSTTQTGKQIFLKHQGDVQTLSYGDNKLRYEIKTDQGTFAIDADNIVADKWHRIGTRVVGDQMQLQVDDQFLTRTISGHLVYSGSNGIELGGVEANMRSLRWYDWSLQPLVAFDNNTSETIINKGTSELVVKSLGNLGKAITYSQLKQLRVALVVDGQRNYVSILSAIGFKELAQTYIGSVVSDATLTKNYQSSPLPGIIPEAYALSLDQVWSGVKEGVGFLVPYEDFITLGKQLMYLATGDWENFKPTELIFSALGVATVLPVAKPLKPLLGPIKKMVKAMERFPLTKHLAGAVGSAVKAATSGKADKLTNLVPFLVVGVEIYEDPETFDFIMKAISSEEDLWSWVEFVGVLIEAGADSSIAVNEDSDYGNYAKLAFPSVIPVAQAAGYDRKKLAKLIVTQLKRVAKNVDDPKKFSPVLKELLTVMKTTDGNVIKKFLSDKTFLGAVTALSKKGVDKLNKFFKDSKNWRVNRFVVLFSILYLEEEVNKKENPLKLDPTEDSNKKLAVLLADVFSWRPWVQHGAIFQLTQLAYYHATGSKIIGIEQTRPAFFVDAKGTAVGKEYKRRIDIVLQDGDGAKKEKWIELKSLSGKFNALWFDNKLTKTKQDEAGATLEQDVRGYYRQFFHDLRLNEYNISPKNQDAILKGLENAKTNSSFIWYFQDFKGKGSEASKSPNAGDLDTARTGLCTKYDGGEIGMSADKLYKANFKSVPAKGTCKNSIELRDFSEYIKELANREDTKHYIEIALGLD